MSKPRNCDSGSLFKSSVAPTATRFKQITIYNEFLKNREDPTPIEQDPHFRKADCNGSAPGPDLGPAPGSAPRARARGLPNRGPGPIMII